jgi:hypothetical protein
VPPTQPGRTPQRVASATSSQVPGEVGLGVVAPVVWPVVGLGVVWPVELCVVVPPVELCEVGLGVMAPVVLPPVEL